MDHCHYFGYFIQSVLKYSENYLVSMHSLQTIILIMVELNYEIPEALEIFRKLFPTSNTIKEVSTFTDTITIIDNNIYKD